MNPSQESGFEGRGVGVPLFSSLFDRFSFAPAPPSFSQLKTIVRQGKLILCKLFLVGRKA
jgi:hypothetical protein